MGIRTIDQSDNTAQQPEAGDAKVFKFTPTQQDYSQLNSAAYQRNETASPYLNNLALYDGQNKVAGSGSADNRAAGPDNRAAGPDNQAVGRTDQPKHASDTQQHGHHAANRAAGMTDIPKLHTSHRAGQVEQGIPIQQNPAMNNQYHNVGKS